MEKINIAELLRDCPQGMELDCTSYDNVSFDKISDDKKATYPIFCYITDKEGNRSSISFTENGCESKRYGAKCVIFPKGKTTWEGFVPSCKFKNGDIIYNQGIKATAIFCTQISNNTISHCFLNMRGEFKICHYHSKFLYDWRLATEEEKQKLFDAIKANGYKWNPEANILDKLPEPKFKDGDIVAIGTSLFIYKDCDKNGISKSYCGIDTKGILWKTSNRWAVLDKAAFATEEQKEKLFKAIKDNGYHWNPETKTLEKLIEPRFKINNIIRHKERKSNTRIVDIKDGNYIFENGDIMPIYLQNDYEFVTDKFDITSLKPFDKVLVRCSTLERWHIQFFEKYDRQYGAKYPFICMCGNRYNQCIPYEGNEHLLDTFNNCNDFYTI